ncbi:MAG: hypothetical protein OXF78_06755 [Rhodospirillales bacterium]|nr:hypothetical protein [Rhodospirillales bacterium]
MKELRFSAADGEWRIAFAFDPPHHAAGRGRQGRQRRAPVLSRVHPPG